MARTALEDQHFELIKSHIINPEESPLNEEQQEMLDRIISAAKILDKNPLQKNAISLLNAKYPHISRSRAFLDVKMAQRLFNTIHNFDYDFWQTWIINNIVENINRVRTQLASASNEKQSGALTRVIAQEHANLIKAIGEKPPTAVDPKLHEKHDFYLVFQQNNTTIKLDLDKVQQLPDATRAELNKIIFGGQEIDDQGAIKLMET